MLLDAVKRGRLYHAKFLLESGMEDVNKTDDDKQTALMKAIFLGDKMRRTRYKIVKLLLEHGARVNPVDREGKTALMWACIRGQEDVVREILEASVLDLDLNVGDKTNNTALLYAASCGHAGIVQRLIAAMKRFGLDVDKKNAQGMTPILEATKQGHDLCAQALITEGKASLTIRDPKTFLNTREWAVRRSMTNLSELIERRSPSPQTAAQSAENEHEVDAPLRQRSTTETIDNNNKGNTERRTERNNVYEIMLSEQQRTDVNVNVKRLRGISESLPSSPQLHDSQTPRRSKKEGPVSLTSSSNTTASLTRRKAERMDRAKSGSPPTAKAEICRLLGLYGIQHSESYRQSFDPILLSPSGYWPDPLAHLRDNTSSVGDDRDLEMNFLDLVRPRTGRRKSSAVPAMADVSRRGSNVNFLRDGRRGSTVPGGLPFAGNGRRGSTLPSTMVGNKHFLEAPAFLPRRTHGLNSNAERRNSTFTGSDRRASLMVRSGGELVRPNLPRRTTHLGYILETE